MNGAIPADMPTPRRSPGREPAGPASPSASPEGGTQWLAFADVLGLAQAMAGTRIETMVQAIVPDGRGLATAPLDAKDQRLGEQAQDAEQAHARKREALRQAAGDDPVRSRRAELREERHREAPRDRVIPRRGSAADTCPRAAIKEALSPTGSDRGRSADVPPPREAGGAALPRPALQAPSVTPSGSTVSSPIHPPTPVADAVASVPTAPPAVAGGSDGGLLARQLGAVLGARPVAEGGRVASVTQTASAGPAESGRRDSPGSSRPTNAPKPPPGRPQTPREAMRAQRGAFDRLVRSIRMQLGPRVSTARLQLSPPELGRVRVDVRVAQQRMELSIQAQTPEARDLLAGRLVELRAALADQGLTLDRCDITLPAAQDALARGGGRDVAGRGTHREVAAADTRPRVRTGSSEGEETESALTEAADGEAIGAVSEMRLDIRV